ncbi:MAG: hypothetical protein DMF61_02245 [Blastocatellia bacterium AA13]|nr:MAG: hypothetical protein DMF61_02245 [Blastocatellia bacterium AA13]
MTEMKRRFRKITLALFAVAVVAVNAASTPAQCAMCKAVVEGSPDSAVNGINLAVVVLLLPPVAIFAGVFVFIFKHRNAPN